MICQFLSKFITPSAALLVFTNVTVATAATLPAGFVERQIVTGLNRPTTLQFAPDGRLFITEQDGRIRIIKNDVLLPTPFHTVPNVHSDGERGLLGIAFDPDFATNHYIYVYYTTNTPFLHNRVSRLTANGDVVQGGSEVPLLDMDNMSGAQWLFHAGGGLNFGTDGKLYILTGDNTERGKAPSLTSTFGKVLRINKDGSIPTDNPFYNQTTGIYRSIWALGLRNPFTGSIQPGTGLFYINDVGENTYEEINEGRRGANYGWPETEGATSDPRFASPVHAYIHNGQDCAITGSAFYNPTTARFPSRYVGKNFFADFCGRWIKTLDPVTKATEFFATNVGDTTDLKVSPSGALYYLLRTSASVFKVDVADNASPVISTDPVSITVTAGQPATFSCAGSGAAPLTTQWQRNSVNISGATGGTYRIASAQASDNGARFRCVISNSSGSATSKEAVLTVTNNQAPTATIVSPVSGTTFQVGSTLRYSGVANDPEQGELPASAFTWQIDFGHGSGANEHFHPVLAPTTGSKDGTLNIASEGHSSRNVFYRFRLTVRDSAGATATTERRVYPAPIAVPAKLEAEDAAHLLGVPESNGHWLMGVVDYVKDQFNFPSAGSYRFNISAAGAFANGDWPNLQVKVNGAVVGSVKVTSASLANYSVVASVPAGVQEVSISFDNDFWDGVNDRNLYVNSVEVAAAAASTPVAIRSQQTDSLFFDVFDNSSVPGTRLITFPFHGQGNQRFEFRPTGEIVVFGNMCLSTSTAAANEGDLIVIAACNGGAHQKWRTTSAGEIRGLNDRCMDIRGASAEPVTDIIYWNCHGRSNQKWTLVAY